MFDPESPVVERASVIGHTLWVTPNRPDERWPAGEFVNQSRQDTGLGRWTLANRSIENTDVVMWYVFGIHHITRPEDWPVMPVDVVSFWLKPFGFFDRNPSLDVVAHAAGHVPHTEHQCTTTDIVERPADLTVDWLTAALGAGRSTEFGFERIGTGQMSECYRVGLTYADGDDGPSSVVLKVAATDPVSRQTGLALGLYEREVRFYTDIAPGIDGPVAPCHHAAFDTETGAFHLLLGDAGPAVVGDEIRGATAEQAMLALSELGRMHAPLLGDTALASADWLNRESPMNQALIGQLYAGFVDRYGDRIAPAHREVCERLVASFDAYVASEAAPQRPHGLVHGDYRLDNMLFGEPGADRPLTVVDWQTVTWGPAMTDVAYFLGCALPDRAAPRALRGAAARLPRRARGRCVAQPRGRARRRAAAELLRGDDGDNFVDARRENRPRRRDVHGDACAALPARARHRCAGRPARSWCRRAAYARGGRRGLRMRRAMSRCGTRVGTSTSPTWGRVSADGYG